MQIFRKILIPQLFKLKSQIFAGPFCFPQRMYQYSESRGKPSTWLPRGEFVQSDVGFIKFRFVDCSKVTGFFSTFSQVWNVDDFFAFNYDFLRYSVNLHRYISLLPESRNIGPCRYLEKCKLLDFLIEKIDLRWSLWLSVSLVSVLNHAENRQPCYRVVNSFSLMILLFVYPEVTIFSYFCKNI